MLSYRLGLCGALLLSGALGCGAQLSRVGNPVQAAAGPPRIDRLTDLGSLPLPTQGPLPERQADGLLTPGEWVAVRGQNLAGSLDARLAGRPLRIGGYLADGGVLLQVPRGLPMGQQVLSIDNGQGRAETPVQTASYVIAADAEGSHLAFRRLQLESDEKGPRLGLADAASLSHSRARFLALSPDGGILYALSEATATGPAADAASPRDPAGRAASASSVSQASLLVVQMGAKQGPAAVASLPLVLPGEPTAIRMSPQGILAIATARAVTLLATAETPLSPRILQTLGLVSEPEPRALTAGAFVNGGRTLALLEAYGNDVYFVDLATPTAPQPRGMLNLSGAVGEPYSIDLAETPDGASLWVLQGPNFRLAGKRLRDGLKGAWGAATTLQWKRAGRALGGVVAPDRGASHARLLRLVVGPQGTDLADEIALPPALLPLAMTATADAVHISVLHGENPFQHVEASLAGVERLFSALRSTVQVGQVLRVDAHSGQIQVQTQGLAMYGELASLPGGGLLIGTLRLGPGYLPPRLTLDFGFEISGGPFSKHREVANTALGLGDAVQRLVPPYRIDRIAAQ